MFSIEKRFCFFLMQYYDILKTYINVHLTSVNHIPMRYEQLATHTANTNHNKYAHANNYQQRLQILPNLKNKLEPVRACATKQPESATLFRNMLRIVCREYVSSRHVHKADRIKTRNACTPRMTTWPPNRTPNTRIRQVRRHETNP